LIAGLSGLVLVGGWIWDRLRRRARRLRTEERPKVTLTHPPEPL